MNNTKKEIAKYLKKSATELYKTDGNGCYNFNLDGGVFTLAVGWLDGYEPKFDDDGLFKSKSQPQYCVNAGILVRNDADCSDFEWMTIPWMTIPWNDETGGCWDNRISIGKDTDFDKLADFYIKEAEAMMEAYEKGELKIK